MKEDVFGIGTIPFLEGGVKFTGIVEDPTPAEKVYRPGHPDADSEGYVRMSNVNPIFFLTVMSITTSLREHGFNV